MDKIHIKDKLSDLNVNIKDIVLGEFDAIGEYTAKKSRSKDHPLYSKAGCFFRPNYERGILMNYLIKKNQIDSVLEIGFGRGYSTFCMAKSMCDYGIDGKITTVDPNLDENFLKYLSNIFPKDWFSKIEFIKGLSDQFFTEDSRNFDFIYIDGDHHANAVKNDWLNSENRFKKLLLFDDYVIKGTTQYQDIECTDVIDQISNVTYKKELIIMDRRIFIDDRGLTDDQINSGQVLVERR